MEENKQEELNEQEEKKLQSEVDKVRGKYSQALREKDEELKKKDEMIKKLREEYMSKEELKKLEMAEKEKELEERQRAYEEERNKNLARDLLSQKQLGLVADKAYKLVMGKNEAAIKDKVEILSEVLDAVKDMTVEEAFKRNGRQVIKTTGNGLMSNNPWAKNSFNLTEQMRLQIEEPERAKNLMAQANQNYQNY